MPQLALAAATPPRDNDTTFRGGATRPEGAPDDRLLAGVAARRPDALAALFLRHIQQRAGDPLPRRRARPARSLRRLSDGYPELRRGGRATAAAGRPSWA